MRSLWSESAKRPSFPTLEGSIKTDVLIIGGGMAGILCAYKLKEAGIDYALVEADRILGGVSAGTTAKITLQHGLIYDSLIRKYDKATARLYLEANFEALADYRRMCARIDCDYREADAYVYSRSGRKKLEDEERAYREIGYPAELYDEVSLPIYTDGALRVKEQAEFHPLKFGFAVAKELNIYENTRVTELKKGAAIANGHTVNAKNIIVATHFPILNKHGLYSLKLYQHRSYVIAIKDAKTVDGMYVDEDECGMSFRSYKNYLLIGGGDHRTGKRGGGWRELEDFYKKRYTGATEVARWAAQDCMTLDGMPYIGRYSKRTDGIFVATGFNKWGMSQSMVAASLLVDLITGHEGKYTEVFSPSRSMLHPKLVTNGLETLGTLVTPTTPRCPHLGCALKYNKAEHSWDCPCHGSRFDEDGELLDGPATAGLKKNPSKKVE